MSERFEKVNPAMNFPAEERAILDLWKQGGIFEQSMKQREGAESFVFYEGPPTANGKPHNGSVLTRVIKDLIPRYKTMRGYYVPRKAGWDTHGLPVEVEVEKELRIHGKKAIEEYGMEAFVKRCIESVFRYTDDWAHLTERIGFWVDLPDAYVTFHQSYVESVWWALSELFKKGLLYKGHKVVWWWAQGGTALSSLEVGQGYREVSDPSVYVEFPLVGEKNTSLVVWTTTPWTLSSNAYAAVGKNFDYVYFTVGEKTLIAAKPLAKALTEKLKIDLVVTKEVKGEALLGLAYEPPFDLYTKSLDRSKVPYWKVIAAPFVTLDSGTGIVHIAPAFGEDDFSAHQEILRGLPNFGADIPLLLAVQADGTFIDAFEKYKGRWVKDCDKDLQADLKERGLLVFAEQYKHEYPFCWRADSDPLIQFARPAWYIRTTEKIQEVIANNRAVEWFPEHIKEGRFGDFLANNVDWALSRERFWGTPLNIWVNDETGAMEAPSSVQEILKKNPRAFDHFDAAKKADPSLSEHLRVHKPWIDQVTWTNPGEAGTYKRVTEVIDCWFDSGCMPFAQWGFPHTGVEQFQKNFPANFISEGIDQTRGWFYSLLMVSSLVFDKETQARFGLKNQGYPHPYEKCVVLGHICDKEGKKESKSKGNYTPPDIVLDSIELEFALVSETEVKGGKEPPQGTCFVAKEDLEGLDVLPGSTMDVRSLSGSLKLKVEPLKGLGRRVALLSKADRETLKMNSYAAADTKPADVPGLPKEKRLKLIDPSGNAPGADAFRWFFYASNPPWNSTRHSLSNVRALQKETLIKFRNVYSFFTIYANIDGWDPMITYEEKTSELDEWLNELLARTATSTTEKLDRYDIYGATIYLADFVDALSNWYVRRSRSRFWGTGISSDKAAAYRTLYQSLVTMSKLMAPFTPFMAESMYQNLVVGPSRASGKTSLASVHLENYPELPFTKSDRPERMQAVRSLVSLGLQVRTNSKLKVRQPLREAKVILSDAVLREKLSNDALNLQMLAEELNVRSVKFVEPTLLKDYVTIQLKPNFRTLGQRGLGKEAQAIKKEFAELSPENALKKHGELLANGQLMWNEHALLPEDIEVAMSAREGFAAASDRVGVVVLETSLDDELMELGLLRELQSRVQAARKEMGLEFTDRIDLSIVSASDKVHRAVKRGEKEFATEVLASSLSLVRALDATSRPHFFEEIDVDGEGASLYLFRAGA